MKNIRAWWLALLLVTLAALPSTGAGINVSGNATGGTHEICVITNSANIAISNATDTAVTFDTETLDASGLHSTASNTSRITFATAGWRDLYVQIVWAASAVGERRQVILKINGATFIGMYDMRPINATLERPQAHSWGHYFAANDYVELFVHQDSGGNLNIKALDSAPNGLIFSSHGIF